MNKQWWATIRIATECLAKALESYAFEMIEKNRSVQKRSDTWLGVEVASDDVAFTVVEVGHDHPILLNRIVRA